MHLEIMLVPSVMLHYYCPGQLLQSEAFNLYIQIKSVITFSGLSSGMAHWDLFFEVYLCGFKNEMKRNETNKQKNNR